MIILALDPGLTTGYAFMELTDDGNLSIWDAFAQPAGILVPARSGMPGLRSLLRLWLDVVLPDVDEVCAEGEISTVLMRSNIESLKVREILDDHITEYGRTPTYYAPTTVKATIKQLSGESFKGLPLKTRMRRMLGPIMGIDWPLGVDHISDALAVGVTHAFKIHGWRPANYMPGPKERKGMDGLIDALHLKYEEAKAR